MNIPKPADISSGIPGIRICPKCDEATCFILPDFNFETMEIIGWSCPACKVKPKKKDES